MIFADLAAGEAVFVDANTLVYHFQPHPAFGPPCSQLLQRIENQELPGFTSTHVLGEAAHRLMTMEAHVLFGWPFEGIGNRWWNQLFTITCNGGKTIIRCIVTLFVTARSEVEIEVNQCPSQTRTPQHKL